MRTDDESQPGEFLVQSLEELRAISAGLDEKNAQMEAANETMICFRKDTEEQFASLVQQMKAMEAFAEQYGEYVPKLGQDRGLDLSYEAFVKEREAAKKEEKENGDVEKKVEEAVEPSLFDCGFSKENLNKLFGIKFKEDLNGKETTETTSELDYEDNKGIDPEKREEERPKPEICSSLRQKNLESLKAAARFSFSSISSEDSTPAVSILKKTDAKPVQSQTPSQLVSELSRVEITPGLFVRKPSSRSREKEVQGPEFMTTEKKRAKPAKSMEFKRAPAPAEYVDSPKMDVDLTLRIDKLLKEQRISMAASALGTAASIDAQDENASPNTIPVPTLPKDDEEVTPELPPPSARKMAALSAMKYKKDTATPIVHVSDFDRERLLDASGGTPLAAESPGSPQLPASAANFMAKLNANRY